MPITYNFQNMVATWNYSIDDEIDPMHSSTVLTLLVIGVKEDGNTYPAVGEWRINMSHYDECIFMEQANEIRRLRLVSLNIRALFPNVKMVSLINLNISQLVLPTELTGLVITDTHINECTLPPMRWLTVLWCYGLFSTLNTSRISRINIFGDIIDSYTISPILTSISIFATKIGKLMVPTNNRLGTCRLIECVSPYPDYIVNKRLATTYPLHEIEKSTYYDNLPVNIRIGKICKINRRIDAEHTAMMLISLRNKSFISKGLLEDTSSLVDGSIQRCMILGSNYPRRSMEFITHL